MFRAGEDRPGPRPLSGELFLFVSRNLIRAKVLYWDGTGLCVFAKRLEQGRFARLWSEEAATVRLTLSELQLFLKGSKLVGKISLSPPENGAFFSCQSIGDVIKSV